MRTTWMTAWTKVIVLVLLSCFSSYAIASFVKIDPQVPTELLDIEGKRLTLRGVNRFAIYEARDNRDDLSLEDYFEFLKKNGFNTVRVFVREGYVKEGRRLVLDPIEPQLGQYSQKHLAELP